MIEIAYDYLADMAEDFFNDRHPRPFEQTPSGAAWCEMLDLIGRVKENT